MTVDEALPKLETVRRDAHYAEYRFFRTRHAVPAWDVRPPVAHVGYKLTTMLGCAAICGVRARRRPLDVSGDERLCLNCEKALESLYKIVSEESNAAK